MTLGNDKNDINGATYIMNVTPLVYHIVFEYNDIEAY